MPINNKNQVNIVLILQIIANSRKLKSNTGLDMKSNLSFKFTNFYLQ